MFVVMRRRSLLLTVSDLDEGYLLFGKWQQYQSLSNTLWKISKVTLWIRVHKKVKHYGSL
jgi:hypothetical protein